MLKSLRISNIVLIENAEVSFSEGFHVLTGETGSGKSAVMGALNYIVGARADSAMLRHHSDKGAIEAAFDIRGLPVVQNILNESGIEHECGEDLIIKREILKSGKSRAFVNHQLAQLGLLKKLGDQLIEIVGQHANQRLMDLKQHREILDLFAGNAHLRKELENCWAKECAVRKELKELQESESQRLREIEICRLQLEELESAQIRENEEEELFIEYKRLTNSEAHSKLSHGIYQALSGDEHPAIPMLNTIHRPLEQLAKEDSSLAACLDTFKSALLELEEVAHEIRRFHANIEFNPERTEEINNRLGLINKLKRKYGPTTEDVLSFQLQLHKKLEGLESADIHIADLQKSLAQAERQTNETANQLSERRKSAAQILQEEMVAQLHALNLPKADFYVDLSAQRRTPEGDESVEFLFQPNIGEKRVSVKDCASGGELSRIMLALQTILAGKGKIPTLVFDEIDANIGGETAAIVGEKLREIGLGHQVFCVTHFPQVAKCAKHHIQIAKKEKEGRTFTEILLLNQNNRQKELSRMSGIN